MYRISVPVMPSAQKDFPEYARLCREAGADRIFLCAPSIFDPIPALLSEGVAYFKEQGFTVGVWTSTIGHGFVLSHDIETDGNAPAFTQMIDITGEERAHANCPLDPAFRAHVAKRVAEYAVTGADIVMLDDDFRMSQHGGGQLCCACPRHLARIGEILGEPVTREKLRPFVTDGIANRYRDAWMRAQNEGLELFAREIRAAVDACRPEVTVALCVTLSCFNVDGVDVAGITRILAGKNKPVLRLTGAPYWASKRSRFPLITVLEIARMLAAFVANEGFDLMSEGDVYPRPRYTCPASYLELYDAALRADGVYGGILKYMFDYTSAPDFETGYLALHNRDRADLEAICALFPRGANAGVRVIAFPHVARAANYRYSTLYDVSPRPFDGTMLGSCGIPTVYRGEGLCNSLFGENARLADLSLLKKGTILDAVSALALTERGIDVGLAGVGEMSAVEIPYLFANDKAHKSFITEGKVRFLSAELAPGAEPVLFSSDARGARTVAYRYENAAGQRFLVFLWEGDSIMNPGTSYSRSGLADNPVTQRLLLDLVPWLADAPLPAVCPGNPDLYMLCTKDGNSLSVGLFNCFADPVLQPVLTLSETYQKITCVGCEAKLEGDRVTLISPLYGFRFAAFRVEK